MSKREKTNKSVIALFTCFNRKEMTINAINKLKNQYSNIDFLVVDDCSTDGTVDAITNIDNVTVIKTKGDYYYTASMRYGMKHILNMNKKYDYLLLMNDDVDFYDGILKGMIKYSIKKNSVVVGTTIDSNGCLSYGGILFNAPNNSYFRRVGSDYDRKVDTFNGNCVLIPYEFFLETGVMDKHYTHYFGDFDYGIALRKNGYDIYVYDSPVGVCDRNSRDNTFLDKQLSISTRLKLKHHPKGLPFREYFYYNYKNFGLGAAIKSNIDIYRDMFKK